MGACGPDQRAHALGEFQDRDFRRIADVDRLVFVRFQQPVNPLDQIRHVAEAARLFAVAIDGDRLADQRLIEEVRQRAAIVEPHARSVGVEDPHDARIHAMVAVVGHGDGLGEALGFVVDAARADGVHVSPVGFRLRAYLGIAIAFRRRGLHEPGFLGHGQPQRIVRAERPDLQRLDREFQVIGRAGGRCEVHHGVYRP